MNFQQKRIACGAIIRKEVGRIIRLWIQILLPPAITTTMYFIIFGSVIGSRIGHVAGLPYMEYIAPGLIMMQVIMGSYTGVVSSFFSAKFQRQIEELLVSPMSATMIIVGFVSAGIFRGLFVGAIVTVIAMFFTGMPLHSLFLVLIVAIVASSIFALGGLINAIYARKFDDISIIPTFVLTPLTYLGGVFYPVAMLTGIWHYLSMSDPIVYIIDAFRYAFLGIGHGNIAIEFLVMLSFVGVLFVFALYLIHKGIGLRD